MAKGRGDKSRRCDRKTAMNFVAPELEKYCLNQSTLPSKLCEELFAYTQETEPMAVMLAGPLVGSFLAFLARTIQAHRILEFGTFTGYSALVMAEQLGDRGELYTLDINPKTTAVAQKFWDRSPHGKKIHALVGPAPQTVAQLTGAFDLVLIDANKDGYIDYLKASLERLSPKGVIVADNALFSGMVLEQNPAEPNAKAIQAFNAYVRSRGDLRTTLLPVRDGLYLIQKSQ